MADQQTPVTIDAVVHVNCGESLLTVIGGKTVLIQAGQPAAPPGPGGTAEPPVTPKPSTPKDDVPFVIRATTGDSNLALDINRIKLHSSNQALRAPDKGVCFIDVDGLSKVVGKGSPASTYKLGKVARVRVTGTGKGAELDLDSLTDPRKLL